MGNITSYTENEMYTETYVYDSLNQLVKANTDDCVYEYFYDNGGNITSAKVNGVTVKNYTYGNSQWKDQLTGFNDGTITYDNIGNPLVYHDGVTSLFEEYGYYAVISAVTSFVASELGGIELKFKSVKPFVFELLTMIGVIGVVLAFSLMLGDIKIYFNKNDIFLVTGIVLVLGWFLYIFVRVINLGVRSLVDYLFQKTVENEYTILSILPYRASIFSDSNTTNRYDCGMYYLVNCKNTNGTTFTFVVSKYLEINLNEKYILKTGMFSGVLIDCIEID